MNSASSTITDAQRAILVDALADPKPFHCEGIQSLSRDQMNLYLASDPCRVRLTKGSASTTDLEKLAAACAPATFGMNKTDVLDESYRKAGKLDRADFGINLDVVRSGLLRSVQHALFGWEETPRDISAELYKLNVYRAGSFFKAHKDTPRGEYMFGSLVLNFPTEHQGGALILRHDGREIVHDPSKAEYTSNDQVSWVAFYSDVEHEVLPVTSGYRVTLTYNLYFSSSPPGSDPSAILPFVDPILAAFKQILGDATFMPNGGRLGFGLKYQYPVPVDVEGKAQNFPKRLIPALKGGDSALFRAAEAAMLEPKLALTYETYSSGTYLVDHVLPSIDNMECSWDDVFGDENGEKLGRGRSDTDSDSDWASDDGRDKRGKNTKTKRTLEWIVPRNTNTRVKSWFIAYGNEAELSSVYGDVVLIVAIPSQNERARLHT